MLHILLMHKVLAVILAFLISIGVITRGEGNKAEAELYGEFVRANPETAGILIDELNQVDAALPNKTEKEGVHILRDSLFAGNEVVLTSAKIERDVIALRRLGQPAENVRLQPEEIFSPQLEFGNRISGIFEVQEPPKPLLGPDGKPITKIEVSRGKSWIERRDGRAIIRQDISIALVIGTDATAKPEVERWETWATAHPELAEALIRETVLRLEFGGPSGIIETLESTETLSRADCKPISKTEIPKKPFEISQGKFQIGYRGNSVIISQRISVAWVIPTGVTAEAVVRCQLQKAESAKPQPEVRPEEYQRRRGATEPSVATLKLSDLRGLPWAAEAEAAGAVGSH